MLFDRRELFGAARDVGGACGLFNLLFAYLSCVEEEGGREGGR